MKRVLIVADHSIVVQSVRMALRQTAGFQVIGFVDGRQVVTDVVAQAAPDVVVVDDMHDGQLAVQRLAESRAVAPEATHFLLTMRMDPEWQRELFDAGADAVISKSVHPVSLGTLLREISRGTVVNRPSLELVREPAVECPLTSRELEILQLVAQGHTNGRIARELWVTEQTVKFHLSNTYRKLGVANRTEASRYVHLHLSHLPAAA